MAQKNLLQSAGDGTAIPAGAIGERIVGTIATGTNIRAAIGNAASISLTTGTYLIFRKLHVATSGQDGTTNLNLNAEIVFGSTSALPGAETYSNFDYSNYSIGQQGPRWIMGGSYYNVTSAGTYYFNARVNFTGTLSTATVGNESYFYAIRIA